ncbi:MAG: J domain-containing protein [Alphaproteobacteria bacterium]|nr:J domain-containing protein [Alphaproteobacteria bacterium]
MSRSAADPRGPGADAPGKDSRPCDKPGCDEPGEFRAPRSRLNLNDYFWFCLDHVREYNRDWNYFAGLGEAEIEAIRQSDTIWNRPTWPLGGAVPGSSPHLSEAQVREAFRAFAARFHGREADGPQTAAATGIDQSQRRALQVFDLDLPVTMDRIKARYKQLVKRHHPDANGGDRSAEERLKEINDAYRTLTQFVLQ